MAIRKLEIGRSEIVDLYSSLSITVGALVRIQNVSREYEVLITDVATEPNVDDAFNSVPPFTQATNEEGDAGFWVYSPYSDSVITVEEL